MSRWGTVAPSSICFLLLNCIVTLPALAYLIMEPSHSTTSRLSYHLVVTGIDGIVAMLWLASFIVTAIFLSERLCFGMVCSAAKAATALGALEWYTDCVTRYPIPH